MRRRNPIGSALLILSMIAASGAGAYPLDQAERTGITRLDAYWLAKDVLIERGTLPPGAFYPTDDVSLRLLDQPNFQLPAPNPAFQSKVKSLLGADARAYGVSVLDLTDPKRPQFAEVNGGTEQNPGSVGKIMVLLAWFQALADVYPDDVKARERLLYETTITANEFIIKDSHKAPFWKHGDPKVVWRPIEVGDSGNLFTFFDWMASASSNAAASQLMANLMLLKHFGTSYPVPQAEADAFFRNTPKSELKSIWLDAIRTPVTRNGIDVAKLRQGSFFTRTGKEKVPGTNSTSTARELMQYMVLMEQGKLVDPWSSLEIKRMLYLTDKRIRYAASPALDESAVYYKSGSLYSCKPEKGFECKKYHGNRYNYLNSIAIVENKDAELHYLVAVLSNVLRKDSAAEHQRLAEGIHELIGALDRSVPAPAGP